MNWLRRVMAGRYGSDQLTIALFVLGLGLSLIGGLCRSFAVQLVSYLPLGYGLYRSFSRNIGRRRAENAKFLQLWDKVRRAFHPWYCRLRDWKTHRYFKCPTCHTLVRVPKGKGRICISCPKCRNGFIKKT